MIGFVFGCFTEWKDKEIPFATGCTFFEYEQVEGELFLRYYFQLSCTLENLYIWSKFCPDKKTHAGKQLAWKNFHSNQVIWYWYGSYNLVIMLTHNYFLWLIVWFIYLYKYAETFKVSKYLLWSLSNGGWRYANTQLFTHCMRGTSNGEVLFGVPLPYLKPNLEIQMR